MRVWVEKREISAIKATIALFRDVPCAISVEECVYNMQVAELCGEAELALRAEERIDSTVSPDWSLIHAAAPKILKHQQARQYQLDRRLNGPDRARRAKINREWAVRNPERMAAKKQRYLDSGGREKAKLHMRAKRSKHAP